MIENLAKDISCGIHYPLPIHLQSAFRFMNSAAGRFPIADKCSSEFVSLPMYVELSEEQIEYVSYEIKYFFLDIPIS